jgi:HAD superfamily hydrolase (TIGR01509 family)
MGSPARDAIVKFHQGHALTETIAEIASEYRDTFLQALGSTTVPLLPGVLDLLERIERKGLPRAIATSSEAVYVERVLGPHRILHRFAFALTCDDVQHGKPHPEVYEKAAARLGCRPAEMVVLEDSVNGLRAAKAAGARCIVVPHAEVPRGELAGADAVVASLEAPLLRELLGLA